MSDVSCKYQLTTVDVYELASSIGNEFEKLINFYGRQSVVDLMPKVITVLEHLEQLSMVVQHERATVADLKGDVQRLAAEKRTKAEERLKYEKELEQIEESWRTDAKDLQNTICKLQDENQKLRSALGEKTGIDDRIHHEDEEHENEMLLQIRTLQDSIHRHGEQLRVLQREVGQKSSDVESAQVEMRRLSRLNREYHHKIQTNVRLTQGLIEEKALLKVELNDRQQQILLLSDTILCLEEQLSRLQTCESRSREDVANAGCSRSSYKTPSPNGSSSVQTQTVLADLPLPTDGIEKSSKAEASDGRDEQGSDEIESDEGDTDEYDPNEADTDDDPDDEDAPVQRPINREPDEKLYPAKFSQETGIKRLFNRIFDKFEKLNFSDGTERQPSN